MKKYIPLLALSALTFCSCSGFLNVQPEGNPATTSYFLNDEQAIDAIDGLYAPIHQEKGYTRIVLGDWRKDYASILEVTENGYRFI